MTENFSLRVLKIAVLIYGFLLFVSSNFNLSHNKTIHKNASGVKHFRFSVEFN